MTSIVADQFLDMSYPRSYSLTSENWATQGYFGEIWWWQGGTTFLTIDQEGVSTGYFSLTAPVTAFTEWSSSADFSFSVAGVSIPLTVLQWGTFYTGFAAQLNIVWPSILAGNDYILGSESSDRLYGHDGDDAIQGNAGNDVLDGGIGADTLSGGEGADSMTGGPGDDIFSISEVGDLVTELTDAGTDRIESFVTYALPPNVENLVLVGGLAINGTGNALPNQLTGNGAANVLNGLSGNDIMSGGAGDDIYAAVQAGDVVTEQANEGIDTVKSSITYVLGSNLENLTLLGVAAINGSGNELDNVLTGNGAANLLNGSAGADTLLGSGGNDTLNGGAGIDILKGGLGDDLYVVDIAGDTVTEQYSAGTDTVQSSVTRTLGAYQESLALTGSAAISGTGNGLGNTLLGNAYANKLAGLAGADTLNGNGGNDTLNGGAGNDILSGGLGKDAFVFNTALNASSNIDTLTDFTSGTDRIRLDDDIFTALTGQAALTADQLWAADGATAAQDASDRIVYDTATGALAYDADGVGGAAAIQFALLATQPGLFVSDFLVIA